MTSATIPDSPAAPSPDVAVRARLDASARWPVLFFLASGGFWLLAAMFLGIVSNIKLLSPGWMGDAAWMSYPRLHPAHLLMLVYGWGVNAGLGVMIWLMARLTRQEVKGPIAYITAGKVWNLALTFGIVGLLAGRGTGVDWLEMPAWVYPVMLLSYALIAGKIFTLFMRREDEKPYISVWFLITALFALPWLLATAWIMVFVAPGAPVMAPAISSWFVGSMLMLFFVPITLACTHYFVPKICGNPLASDSLALFSLWGVLGLGAWSGMQRLMGGPLPAWMPAVSGAALIIFLIPALLTVFNHFRTIGSQSHLIAASPTLRFNVAGLWGFLVFAALGAAFSLLFFSRTTQFSQAVVAYWHTGILGMFTMAIFGAIIFLMPRLVQCEWLSAKQLRFQFWFSTYGACAIVVLGLVGGLWQGGMVFALESEWKAVVESTRPYITGRIIAFILIFLSNLVFVANLWRMILRKGREAGSATLLHSPHDDEDAHAESGAASA